MKRFARTVTLLVAGFCMGVTATVGGYLYLNRSTTVYRTTAELRSGDIRIPEGTDLIHHRAMSEGFDTLVLYFNVQPTTVRHRFITRVESKSFLVIPYWVEPTSAER